MALKVIIAGSRDIRDYSLVFSILEKIMSLTIEEVVSGCANGVDSLGERWAEENNIPVKHFPADWDKHGKAAGPIRNCQMAAYADAAVVIHNGSRGSKHMIETMKKLGKPVYEVKV